MLCSVWTIDLAHLLRKFCLDVTFTTLTLGANPQYSTESFYMEHLQEDAERVNQLFQVSSSSKAVARILALWDQMSACYMFKGLAIDV